MGALAPYKLAPGPEVGAWFEVYPAAFATDGFAANIGLFGSFDYGIGAQSKLPSGTILTTKYQDFTVGGKVRIPLGMIIPYVAGSYSMQKFHLEPVDNTRPNFNYGYVNVGAGARVQFTPAMDADVGGGYLIVTNMGSQAGEVQALYPNAKASGIALNLSLGYRVTSLIGIRIGADFRQIGSTLHWRPATRAWSRVARPIGTSPRGVAWRSCSTASVVAAARRPKRRRPRSRPRRPRRPRRPGDEEPGADSNEKPSDVE